MSQYKKMHFEDFKSYAMRDAVIPLHHSLNIMEVALKVVGKYYLPVTLSSLAQELLSKRLGTSFQLPTNNKKYSVREIAKLFTPKGIEMSGGLSEYLPYYMASLRGGRNESFIYGRIPGPLYDFDLPSAYATALSLVDMPDYQKVKIIDPMNQSEFLSEYGAKLVHSYTALKIQFEFPEHVQYPNLGVRLDDTSLIFPLSGITFCTGVELRLALSLGCTFTVLGGRYIPFKEEAVKNEVKNIESKGLRLVQTPLVLKALKGCESTLKTFLIPTTQLNVERKRKIMRGVGPLNSSQSVFKGDDVPTGESNSNDEMDNGLGIDKFDKSHGFKETRFFELMS